MGDRHDEQLFSFKELDKIFPVIDVIDNLDSTSITRPLSAKQGKMLKDMINSKRSIQFKIVAKLPQKGENDIIYLVRAENSEENTNLYNEYIWVADENRFESIGAVSGKVSITIDDALSETSMNPVQNKIITAAINRINKKLFPLAISVSGGGLFEKRTTQNITVTWSIREGSDVVVPDSITVNSQSVDKSSTSKVFNGVTTNTTYTVQAVKDGVTVTGSTNVTFVNPSYFGAVANNFSPTQDNIKALTKSIKNGKGYNNTVNLNNQKVCYAYPKSFGALTAIKDANNFDYINSYTRSEVTVWDEVYYVYILTDATTINNFKQVYS